jgi:hypothetical protein
MPLALYTFGIFAKPANDPANAGFHDLNDPILATVGQAKGFIARSGYASDGDSPSWGPEVYPRFYQEAGDGWSPATLSLWTDLESLFAYTYFGLHSVAFKRGREWFKQPEWPPLVMWWHNEQSHPIWAEGVRRHEYLHDHGPSPVAFTFKVPFDHSGAPVQLDKARIQSLTAQS